MFKFLIKYYKVFIHILVWGIFFVLHLAYFSSIKGVSVALERGIIIIILFLFTFYFNWFFLIPKLYIKRKKLIYYFSGAALIIFITILRVSVEKHYGLYSGLIKYQLLSGSIFRPYILTFAINLFIFFISFLLKIVDYYTIQTYQKDLLLQQKTEAELKFLKAQLNPHFLFNALNNIYALVLTKSENAAGALMSLSQLLRYIIYEASEEKVLLSKEITYLKYYIELESLRLANRNNLKLDISIEENNNKIMPMLFIPFVENSFKHCNLNQDGRIYIRINLKDNELEFICENTFSEKGKNVDSIKGVGLLNSKKRLEMIYPQRHILKINKQNGTFCLSLKISL
ncbi:MAG TPA: hypothetical protein DCG75_10885 [Bacteroidales bacterium]|nr:hypothetical protein [Bacteroidales bacterium]